MRADAALVELDAVIEGTPAAERPGLVVALAARLAALGAGLMVPTPAGGGTDENVDVPTGARRLGVSQRYVYRHADSLPTVRIGRRLLLSSRGIDRYIQQRQGKA